MKILIPKPCYENWDKMTPDAQGRFCSACCKSVKDFSNISDEEMLIFFSSNKENICGNFNENQLNRNLSYSFINSLLAKFAVGFVLTSGGIISVNAQQSCETKKDTIIEQRLRGKVAISDIKKNDHKKSNIIVKGEVSKKNDDKKPLYILNGKEIDEEQMKSLDQTTIKSVNILKDKSAKTLYGIKGKNGVIIITTKN